MFKQKAGENGGSLLYKLFSEIGICDIVSYQSQNLELNQIKTVPWQTL